MGIPHQRWFLIRKTHHSLLKFPCLIIYSSEGYNSPPKKQICNPHGQRIKQERGPNGVCSFFGFWMFFFAFLLPSGVQFCFFDFWRCLKVFCIYCLLMFYFWGFNQQIEGFKASKKRTTFKKRAFQASATIIKWIQ